MDFNAIWVPVANELVAELARIVGRPGDEQLIGGMLSAMGIDPISQKVAPRSVWAMETVPNTAKVLGSVLLENGVANARVAALVPAIPDMVYQLTTRCTGQIKPLADLPAIFEALHRQGLTLGLATADTHCSTVHCLRHLSIENHLDFVGCDGGDWPPKPDPAVLAAFCDSCGLEAETVAVVGDSMVDLEMARRGKAELAIGVLSGASDLRDLDPLADMVISSVAELINPGGELLWDV